MATHTGVRRDVSSFEREMHAGERQRIALLPDRARFLEELCAEAECVAHLGCTDSPYTLERLRSGDLLHARLISKSSVTGFDIDAHALVVLKEHFKNQKFVCVDIAKEVPAGQQGQYDLVLAGEVLEHLPDVGSFLHGCKTLLTDGGRLCVSVPNACSPKIALRAIFGHELVHPDHFVYFSPRTLARTLCAAGFDVTLMASYFASTSRRARIANFTLRGAHHLFHGPIGDGLVALAKPIR